VSVGPSFGRLARHLRRTVGNSYYAFYYVVDVGEASFVLAVVEDFNRFAGEYCLGEQEQRHVRAAPGAVDGEESEARVRDVIEVGITVGHLFVGLFCCRVQTHRVFGALVLGERHLCVGAVDGAGRGEYQVLDAVVAAALQYMQRAGNVAGNVDVLVFGGIAYAGRLELGEHLIDAFIDRPNHRGRALGGH